jgi:hypothetical protein
MTRALRPSHFHSAKLMRVLAELALVDSAASGAAFAQKLGLWVSFTDAIALCAVHSITPTRPVDERSQGDGVRAVVQDFARVRATLEQALHPSGAPKGSKNRITLPAPDLALPLDAKTAFEPYRRYYQAQQREMEQSVDSLRTRVRAALTHAWPKMQQLAALDGALAAILGARESRLLATLPSLLEQRFGHLLQVHQQHLSDQQLTDQPALWLQAGSWLARFGQELHSVLLAELDLRLQPTLGLVEALQNEKKTEHA